MSDALAALRRAITRRPAYPLAFLDLGQALAAAGRPREGIAALEDGARSLFKAINIAAGPLLLLAVGAAVFLLRRRARRSDARAIRSKR